MKVSVAMTVYNGEKYIIEQLESIKNQTLCPDEVVICDDCSTDGSVQKINRYISENNLSNRWVLIRNDKQVGFIKNFIKAIGETSGDYVFLSDQDDIFYPTKFERMTEFMESHSDCVLLNAGFETVDENSTVIKSIRSMNNSRKAKEKKLDFRHWLYESKFPGFSMCIKTCVKSRLLEANITHCYGHDQLLGLIALDIDGNYEISDVLSGYRVHSNNVTTGSDFLSDYRMETRVSQKKKEYREYSMLEQMIEDNSFKNVNMEFLHNRQFDLSRRIEALEKKKLLSMIFMILSCNTYPRGTLIGDLFFCLRSFRREIR